MRFGMSFLSRITTRPLQRSFIMPRISGPLVASFFSHRSLKSPAARRFISYQSQIVPPSNPTMTLLSAGGLMLSTYLVLNHLLNRQDESAVISSKTIITPSVHAYLKGTYTYVAGGLAITAASAVAAFRSGLAVRILQTNPILYMGGSLIALFGTTYVTRSVDHRESPIVKHLAWGASMATAGALSLSPLMFMPQVVLTRAALYTAGIVGSLSLIAINAEDGKFLYLGGPLFAGLTVVALSSVAGVFLPPMGTAFNVAQSISLYGGLAVFGGLMLFDTQVMIEEARYNKEPNPDFIDKSYVVYWNVLNIFIRMVQVVATGQAGFRKK